MTTSTSPASDTSVLAPTSLGPPIGEASTTGAEISSQVWARLGERLLLPLKNADAGLRGIEELSWPTGVTGMPNRTDLPSAGDSRRTAPIAVRPQSRFASYSYALQQWEGVVVSLDDVEFVARLRDLFHPERAEQLVTIETQEVSDPDLALIAPGAVFYWTIAQRTELHGQKSTQSTILFQRPTPWREDEIARVNTLAEKLDAFFSLDNPTE